MARIVHVIKICCICLMLCVHLASGIPWGATLRVVRKDEYKPLLHVKCNFNKQIIPILDKVCLYLCLYVEIDIDKPMKM